MLRGEEREPGAKSLVEICIEPTLPSSLAAGDCECKEGKVELIIKSGQSQIYYKICHQQEVAQRITMYQMNQVTGTWLEQMCNSL